MLLMFLLASFVSALVVPQMSFAAADSCYCYSVLNDDTIKNTLDLDDSRLYAGSCTVTTDNCIDHLAKLKQQYGDKIVFLTCDPNKYEPNVCAEKASLWPEEKKAFDVSRNQYLENNRNRLFALPPCVLADKLSTQCRDVSVFISLLINWGRGTFGIIGGFALAYFIYGGFILILSQGNSEKVQKGLDTMLAAFIGLFVVFAAYLFIKFFGTAIGVKPQYNLQ